MVETQSTMVMKRIKQLYFAVLVALLTLLVLSFQTASAEIRNGYEYDFSLSIESLNALYDLLLNEDLSRSEKNAVKASIKSIEANIIYYQVTENLLVQFRNIAPHLYNEIDTIVDKKGRPVDVYIRFVPGYGTETKALGTTYINQALDDKDTYLSEFGKHAVSVKVWTVNKGLLILAHELGHVKYQVANLDSYLHYYKGNYCPQRVNKSNCLGHDPGDPSGNTALEFEKRFRKAYSNFLRLSEVEFKAPTSILSKIKKELRLVVVHPLS